MLRSVASDLRLHCLLMSHKKDARLIWVKYLGCIYVTHIICILYSSNCIYFEYKAVLAICIGMACAVCETETVTIKKQFFV